MEEGMEGCKLGTLLERSRILKDQRILIMKIWKERG